MTQDKLYKIAIIGPSGSGKGTQAQMLASYLNIPTVSMGELLRSAAQQDNERGKKIEELLLQGKHAPNEYTNEMIAEWIRDYGQNGYIIEGYPRNREQFDNFEATGSFTHAIVLVVSDEETVIRLDGRRTCPCGKVYHMKYKPPMHDETCDSCGQKLEKRHDNTPEATQQQIKLYHEAMVPLLDEYRKQEILYEIDGEQTIENVSEEIKKIFNLE